MNRIHTTLDDLRNEMDAKGRDIERQLTELGEFLRCMGVRGASVERGPVTSFMRTAEQVVRNIEMYQVGIDSLFSEEWTTMSRLERTERVEEILDSVEEVRGYLEQVSGVLAQGESLLRNHRADGEGL